MPTVAVTLFQFQTGSIKSVYFFSDELNRSLFQFQTGSIKSLQCGNCAPIEYKYPSFVSIPNWFD